MDAELGRDSSVVARADRLLRYLLENFDGFQGAEPDSGRAAIAPDAFFEALSRMRLAPAMPPPSYSGARTSSGLISLGDCPSPPPSYYGNAVVVRDLCWSQAPVARFPRGSYVKREFFRLLRMRPVTTEQVVCTQCTQYHPLVCVYTISSTQRVTQPR